jgi:predicted ATPase with chaperone activity
MRYSCPCGYYNDPVKACTCPAGTVTKYQKRISGPLLDRIDIYIQVVRDYIFSRQPSLEELLRGVAREELAQYKTE